MMKVYGFVEIVFADELSCLKISGYIARFHSCARICANAIKNSTNKIGKPSKLRHEETIYARFSTYRRRGPNFRLVGIACDHALSMRYAVAELFSDAT